VEVSSNFFEFDGRWFACAFDRDITDRKRAEEENRKLRSYLENIINSMPSLLVGVDVEGNVTQWNVAAERATGVRATEALGQPIDRLLPMLSLELDKLRKALGTRTVEKATKLPRTAAGETRYDDVIIYPLVTNGVEGAVIRVDDVTERVRIEEMMIQSEKMVSVGGLAAGMAHEINNPLGVILQASQNVLRRVSPDFPANIRAAEACGTSLQAIRAYLEEREILLFLEDIRQSGHRAAEIVGNILNFSRKTEGLGNPTDMAALLDRTLALAASDYDLKKRYDFRQIEIVREYETGIPKIICQESKIQQVFLNILRNGAEVMSEGNATNRPPRFTLRIEKDNAMVRVVIEDNGPGMDEGTRKRVFEPFFTTKPPGSGTGLGLSISYFIITEDHRGSMRVESSPGNGTRFIIGLPMKDAAL
jgi:PAS domain S-box-containing protein